jgi:hypothetical protein
MDQLAHKLDVLRNYSRQAGRDDADIEKTVLFDMELMGRDVREIRIQNSDV